MGSLFHGCQSPIARGAALGKKLRGATPLTAKKETTTNNQQPTTKTQTQKPPNLPNIHLPNINLSYLLTPSPSHCLIILCPLPSPPCPLCPPCRPPCPPYLIYPTLPPCPSFTTHDTTTLAPCPSESHRLAPPLHSSAPIFQTHAAHLATT